MELRFRHGPLQTQEETVVKGCRIVEAIFIQNEGSRHGTYFEHLMQSTLPHIQHRLALEMPSGDFLQCSRLNRDHWHTSTIIAATIVSSGETLRRADGGKRDADTSGVCFSRIQEASPPRKISAHPNGG